MSDFFRFPHTPHVAWLGEGQPREDKVLSPDEVELLLASPLVVEEKIDGANVGFSASNDGELLVQNRGSYLSPQFCHEQFRSLWPWLNSRKQSLLDALWPDRILFGEWCVAVHSIEYDRLPDWFLGFDVFDRTEAGFWDTGRRDALLAELELFPVPRLGVGRFDLPALEALIADSRCGSGPMEGLIARREADGMTAQRGKLVRAEFTQHIESHWSRGRLRRNALKSTPTRS